MHHSSDCAAYSDAGIGLGRLGWLAGRAGGDHQDSGPGQPGGVAGTVAGSIFGGPWIFAVKDFFAWT